MTTIPVTLSTGSVYTYGTARAFELAARVGFDGVELLIDERWDTLQPPYLRRLAAETGAAVLSVHSPFAPIPAWPRAEVERIKRALDVAQNVGARTLNLHVPHQVSDVTVTTYSKKWRVPLPWPSPDQRAYAAWLLDGGLAALQERTAVTITVENLPARRVFGRRFNAYALNTWEELALFPRLCLDTTHCGTWDADPVHVLERLGNRVKHVHLSDWTGRYQHQPLGRGILPLGPFLKALATRGYDGPVVVELTPQGLPVQDEAKLERELRRNLDFCRQHLAQTTTAPEHEPVAAGA
jgi:sugar phosphate isomerase/epimerase